MEWLKSVLPKVSEKMGQIIYNKSDLKELKQHFDTYFLQLFCNLPNIQDKRLDFALNKILHSQGNLIVKDLDVGLSTRQLRRLFEFYLGDSPKAFSKVVRFQNILKSVHLHDALSEKSFFYDFGYYDQSHFIKDFKTFYGLRPKTALKGN